MALVQFRKSLTKMELAPLQWLQSCVFCWAQIVVSATQTAYIFCQMCLGSLMDGIRNICLQCRATSLPKSHLCESGRHVLAFHVLAFQHDSMIF